MPAPPDNRLLTDNEHGQVQRLFSDPLSIPLEFKQWLVRYLESSDMLLPRSSVHGIRAGGAAGGATEWEDVGTAGAPGGGIDFDTYPQSGDWLYIETTGAPASGYGIEFKASNGIWLHGPSSVVVEGDIGAVLRSANGNVGIHADGTGKRIEMTADQLFSVNSSYGYISIEADAIKLNHYAHGIDLDSANGLLHIDAVGVKLATPIAPWGASHPLHLAASGEIHIDSGQTLDAAIFLNTLSYVGLGFSIIGESGRYSVYPQRGFLFELPAGGKFVVADADYTSVHGDRPMFAIDYTVGGVPTYHIRSGATWAADL